MNNRYNTVSQRALEIGDIVRHFKYETLTEIEQTENKYTYVILAFGTFTETDEPVVVYQALYGNYEVYVRPQNMFVSEVDHTKYPDVKQKYRFEKINSVKKFVTVRN